jgi:hypothetical protein
MQQLEHILSSDVIHTKSSPLQVSDTRTQKQQVNCKQEKRLVAKTLKSKQIHFSYQNNKTIDVIIATTMPAEIAENPRIDQSDFFCPGVILEYVYRPTEIAPNNTMNRRMILNIECTCFFGDQ